MRLVNRRAVACYIRLTAFALAVLVSGCEPPRPPAASATNSLPICNGLAGFEPHTISIGQRSSLVCHVLDSEGDPVTWTVVFDVGNFASATIAPRSGSGDVTAVLTGTSAGQVRVLLTLSDGKGFTPSIPYDVSVVQGPPRDP
jgi:hypothetical protein